MGTKPRRFNILSASYQTSGIRVIVLVYIVVIMKVQTSVMNRLVTAFQFCQITNVYHFQTSACKKLLVTADDT